MLRGLTNFMASTDLNLLECGSLPKPGIIGRLMRFILGGLSLYYVYGLWVVRLDLLTGAGGIKPLIWNGILPALLLISYVINIGFSRAWKKWPAIIAFIIMLGAGVFGLMQSGNLETVTLARAIWSVELYTFAHLGLSFLLAALLATPGCEMRAVFHLYSKITGKPTKEHHCPVGPLNNLDKWEHARANK
jgi:hypothetical protein